MGISGTIMYEAVVKSLLMMVNASKIDGLSANDDVYIYIYIYTWNSVKITMVT